jgi:hypothetical protein
MPGHGEIPEESRIARMCELRGAEGRMTEGGMDTDSWIR